MDFESNSTPLSPKCRNTPLSKAAAEKDEERNPVKTFWQAYGPSLESMMLNHDAHYLAENEQNELLSYLPSYKGLRILELGAGIGRFTSRFALLAHHVTAVDFMESFVEENKKANGHYDNISYKCADVTTLDFEDGCFDLIFTNWLFMYLTTDETENMFTKMLKWLSPNGHFFMRESCYHQSGNMARHENPTKYRTPIDYMNISWNTNIEKSHFQLLSAKNVLAYVHHYGNPNQFCILLQKRNDKRRLIDSFQRDTNVGRIHHNLFSSFSKGEVVTNSIKSICNRLELKPGQRVLHLGCGLGDNSTEIVALFNTFVHGVDSSPAKIHTAIEKQGKLEMDVRKKIQFECCEDLSTINLPQESYEAIICEDAICNSTEASNLIRRMKIWLKTNGKLFITDFFTNKNLQTSNKDRKLELSQEDIEVALKEEGFNIQQIRIDSGIALSGLKRRQNAPLEICANDETNSLFQLMEAKIKALENGSMTWVKILACK